MEQKMPGKSYAEMILLLNANVSVIQPTPFTSFTMLSFFWEETFFNNISQIDSGTGVGFGQAEPAEFYRFDANGKLSALAKQKGYLVEGLPRVQGKKLLGTLNDHQSVRVACAYVRDLYEKGVKTKQGIMNAYGGVGFQGPQPAHMKGGGREAILKGIADCELALWQAKSIDAIISALQLARPFDDVAGFRAKLFPGQ
jgi:hypothetical protein